MDQQHPARFFDSSRKGDLPKMVRELGYRMGHEGQRRHNKENPMQILAIVLHRLRQVGARASVRSPIALGFEGSL